MSPAVEELSRAERRSTMGESLAVRVACTAGSCSSTKTRRVYGLAANVTARVQALAEPGQVMISDQVRRSVDDRFDTESAELSHSVAWPPSPTDAASANGRRRRVRPRARCTPCRPRRRPRTSSLRGGEAQRGRGDAAVPSILITGEPGMGKSRLAASIAQDVAPTAPPSFELAGSSFHTDAGFHPVRRCSSARSGIGGHAAGEERLARLRRELGAGARATTTPCCWPPCSVCPPTPATSRCSEGRKLNDEIRDAARALRPLGFGGGPGSCSSRTLQWFDDSTIRPAAHPARPSARPTLSSSSSRRRADTLPRRTTIVVEPRPAERVRGRRRTSSTQRVTTRPAISAGPHRTQRRDPAVPRGARARAVRSPRRPTRRRPGRALRAARRRLYTTAHGVPVAAAAATIGRVVDRTCCCRRRRPARRPVDAELNALLEGPRAGTWIATGLPASDTSCSVRSPYELQPPSHRAAACTGRVADLLAGPSSDPDLVDWPVVATHYDARERPATPRTRTPPGQRPGAPAARVPEARAQLGRAIDHVAPLPDDRSRMRQEVGLRLRRGFLAMTAEAAGAPTPPPTSPGASSWR